MYNVLYYQTKVTFRGIIETIIMCAIYLTFSTIAAEVMTGLASYTGLAVPDGAT